MHIYTYMRVCCVCFCMRIYAYACVFCSIVNEVANSLFMGGRRMNRHSFNILLSVCEEKLHTCLDDTVIASHIAKPPLPLHDPNR